METQKTLSSTNELESQLKNIKIALFESCYINYKRHKDYRQKKNFWRHFALFDIISSCNLCSEYRQYVQENKDNSKKCLDELEKENEKTNNPT